jgi:hypothetical protein
LRVVVFIRLPSGSKLRGGSKTPAVVAVDTLDQDPYHADADIKTPALQCLALLSRHVHADGRDWMKRGESLVFLSCFFLFVLPHFLFLFLFVVFLSRSTTMFHSDYSLQSAI